MRWLRRGIPHPPLAKNVRSELLQFSSGKFAGVGIGGDARLDPFVFHVPNLNWLGPLLIRRARRDFVLVRHRWRKIAHSGLWELRENYAHFIFAFLHTRNPLI
jgi:hypothetical protein